ncbi:hypothetical protein BACPEC_02197 [[Bacteroides] pectinophilus ATCC 43243]|uniref:Uncharacterized protein n=1 Tax=[Bacteroides] pectinophilus ATCC 43243 TaxID=483218 RepID=B7ASY8_9FIRM|nr:hypothetical protein BACPEC_02197 [[Bacteroides] pectinophilus ATCC 43243]
MIYSIFLLLLLMLSNPFLALRGQEKLQFNTLIIFEIANSFKLFFFLL